MIKTLFLLTLFLWWHLGCKAQDSVSSKPKFYTHSLILKVKEIDTVLLVDEDYRKNSRIPSDNFKAICVKLKVLSTLEGVLNQKSITIMLDLSENEHNCFYNFVKGKTYRAYVFAFRYKSKEILKKYRKKYYKLDCYHPPVEVLKD